MTVVAVTLPHGLMDPGGSGGSGGSAAWTREAWIRPLTGHDELLVADWAGLPRARVVSELLARLVVRLGSVESPGLASMRALTAGDRASLLLHARRATFGSRLDAVVACSSCGEALDVALEVGDLLVPPVPAPKADYAVRCAGHSLRVRPIDGRDLERAGSAADDLAGIAALLSGCVLASEPPLPDGPWPDALVAELSAALARLDPQAELGLLATCPECGNAVESRVDAADVLLRELGYERARLDYDVHCLATGYHWSESAILELPRERRRRYADWVAAAWTGEGA